MNKKNGKAIVNELLDDLLDDEQETVLSSPRKEEEVAYDIFDDVGDSSVLGATNAKVLEESVIEISSIQEIESPPSLNMENEDHTMPIEPPTPPGTSQIRTSQLNEEEDKTMAIPLNNQPIAGANKGVISSTAESIRAGVGRFMSSRAQTAGGSGIGSTEAVLSQSEALRIAQERIMEVEDEVERLREENEGLAAAGEAISKHVDELKAKFSRAQNKNIENEERFSEERETLLEAIRIKDSDLESRRIKEDEFDVRLASNLKKVRVRERELENRLELVKLEGSALLRSKDEIILDMKRQLDQSLQEIESYRSKGQELGRQLTEKQDMLRRTVKALRLALSMLDGEVESEASSGKKVG